MKKVVVTGAKGFIGRHLLKTLIDNNVQVYGIIRDPGDISGAEAEGLQEGVKWIAGDLGTDGNKIVNSIIANGGEAPDCFYHLAWSGVAAFEKNNLKRQMENIQISSNAVMICKMIQCRRFINLGTVGEYVRLDGLINEKCAPSPADVYGAMKVAVRNLASVLAQNVDIEMINTILCSTYGEFRCDDNVISYTIKKLLRNEETEYGNLEQMWDFLYVDDVAYALYLLGEKGIGGKTYSIGSGKYRALREYIETVRDRINPAASLGIGKLAKKYERIMNSCVDTFQLQKDTGFRPRFTFEEGIDRTISYFREELLHGKA